jgi:subtilisin family serine protease
MYFSRGAQRRVSVTRYALFISFLVVARFSFAQTVSYNGHTARVDEVLVRLKSTDAASLGRVKAALPSAAFQNLSRSLAIHLVRVPGLNFQVWLNTLAKHPDVLYVEPNYVVQKVNTPNDPNYPLLWGMPQMSAPSAWNLTTGGTAAVLGVVDTGIDYTHPDLAANVWSAPAAFTVTVGGTNITCPAGSHGFNAITKTCDPADDNGHGTHVSGTIGAVGNNNMGVAGINWTARIMGLKFMDSTGSGTVADAINAIEFAVQVKAAFSGTSTPVNVRILSNSWGGGSYTNSMVDEINKANSSDILFVAAAGNSSSNNDAAAFYPASYSASNVIAVAATDSTDSLASFSDFGLSSVHLGAPGVNIYSTIPGGGYTTMSGTSMATPQVSGAALLTVSACPSLNTAALKAALLSNVDSVPSLAGKTATGGRLNVYKTILSCAPIPSTLKASYLGATGPDYVGSGQLSPDGVPDWQIQLQGLRGTPIKIRITSSIGGVWETPFNGANSVIYAQYGSSGTGDLWFEPWSIPGFHVKVWYSDSTTDETDATSSPTTSPLKASFLGATGPDFVGSAQLSPDGVSDWHIQLQGLRGTPTKVRITSSVGGVWETPFNGANSVIYPQYGSSGTGDLWFEPWSIPGFHVKVWYSDSTTDEADASNSVTTSTLKASYLGATGPDYVGSAQFGPDGVSDWHIQLQGLRDTPIKVRITSSVGGIWESPFNGANSVIYAQYGPSGTGDLWFEPWSIPGFHVKVWYSDSTTDETDAISSVTNSTLGASYLGATGPDFVGSGQFGADGIPDWHIQLQGLRGTPTKVRITSGVGGIWETPFNGANSVIYGQYGPSGTGDLWFEPWSIPGFHVKVWYSDSTTDEADAS